MDMKGHLAFLNVKILNLLGEINKALFYLNLSYRRIIQTYKKKKKNGMY